MNNVSKTEKFELSVRGAERDAAFIYENEDSALSGRGRRSYQSPICTRTLTCELSGEFSLPDYQPEIRRLLRVNASVMPPAGYQGISQNSSAAGGIVSRAEFSGTVDYSLLYSDNDGRLCMASFSSEYALQTPLENQAAAPPPDVRDEDGAAAAGDENGDRMLCFADIEPDMVSGRATAPRRVAIRCRLRASVFAYSYRSLEYTEGGSAPSGSVERLTGISGAALVMRGESDRVSLSDEIVLESGGDIRIIMPESCVFVSEASASSGGYVSCRGDVILKLLLCRENPDSEPYTVVRKLAFNTQVEVDGVLGGNECRAFGKALELSLSVEDGRILCEVGLVLEAEAQRNEAVSYTGDIYSTARVCESKKAAFALPRALKCMNTNFTSGGVVRLEELGIEAGATVIDTYAGAVIGSVSYESERGSYIVTGESKYCVLFSSGEEFFVKDITLPFRYETEGSTPSTAAENSITAAATAEVISTRCRIDGEKLGIDSEIFLSMRISGKTTVEAVYSVTYGDPLVKSCGEYVICYPEPDASLWSVGKKFNAEINSLALSNNIKSTDKINSPESLQGLRYLLL